MTTTTPDTDLIARIVALLTSFKLPTLAAELVPRFNAAGRGEVLPLLLEVFELWRATTAGSAASIVSGEPRTLPPGKRFWRRWTRRDSIGRLRSVSAI